MFWLPIIEAPHWRLPFTLSATIGLANAWLASTPGERQSRFCRVLVDEPGLVIWTLASVSEFRVTAPQGGIAELADWWLAHGPSALSSAHSAFARDERSGTPHSLFRDRMIRPSVAAVREVADHLGELAVRAAARRHRLANIQSTASTPVTDAAWWGSWLADAAQWCQRDDTSFDGRRGECDSPYSPDPTECLPGWLNDWLSSTSPEPEVWPPLDESARLRARWRGTSDEWVDLDALFAWMAGRTPSEAAYAERLQREKLASLRELAYGASHEINNPLANIATRAQALLRDERDPERQRSLAVIASQAFRAHDMIADMMFVAKPPPLTLARTDLATRLARLTSEWTERADRQGTRLTYRASTETPLMADVDEHAIGLAVGALVANALDALGTSGQVVVELGRARRPDQSADQGDEASSVLDGIAISVRDDGPGIPAEVRRHLFDPYFSGREAGRGLGFGLCKAWRIAADHGGLLTVESESGRGATFTLWIPPRPTPLTGT